MINLLLAATCFLISAASYATPPKHILVIGDSISEGYTKSLKLAVSEKGFQHNYLSYVSSKTNAKSTTYGVTHIDEWLDNAGTIDWVLYNQGLWDVQNDEGIENDIPHYKTNLNYIIGRIKARVGTHMFVVGSTYVPPLSSRYGYVESYNTAMAEVAASNSVAFRNLFPASYANRDLLITPEGGDAHWTSAGYDALEETVMDWLNDL